MSISVFVSPINFIATVTAVCTVGSGVGVLVGSLVAKGFVGTSVGTDEGVVDGIDVGEETGVDEGTDVGIEIGSVVGTDDGAPVGRDVGSTVGADVGREVGNSSMKRKVPTSSSSDCDVITSRSTTVPPELVNLLLPSEETSHMQVVLALEYDSTTQLTSFVFKPPLMTPLEPRREQVGFLLNVLQLYSI